MRFLHSLTLMLLLVPSSGFADQSPAPPPSKAKLLDLPQKSFTLDGIVNNTASAPFACSFGRFTVKINDTKNNLLAVTLSGSGILLNSGWLHTQVASNPKITYLFPGTAPLTDGGVISAFCSGSGKPGEAKVDYYVLERTPTPPQPAK